jgi:hypothetical protein
VKASGFSSKGDPASSPHLYESIGEMPHLHKAEKALQQKRDSDNNDE